MGATMVIALDFLVGLIIFEKLILPKMLLELVEEPMLLSEKPGLLGVKTAAVGLKPEL